MWPLLRVRRLVCVIFVYKCVYVHAWPCTHSYTCPHTYTHTHCINTHIPTDSLSTHTQQCAYACAYTYACFKSFDLHLNGQMLPYELHNMLSCNSWLSTWSATSMYKQTKLRRYFKNRTTTDKTKSKATTVEQCKNQNLTLKYSS